MAEDGSPAGRAGRAAPDGGTAGFTLVEMLVTLAILGIAVTLAFRSVGGVQAGRRSAHLSGALAAEIGLLRAEALRTGSGGRLVYDPASGRFLSSRGGASPIAAPLQVTVEAGAGGAPGEIRFLPDGGSTGGRIILQDAAVRLVLAVSAATGRVRRDEIR